MGAGDGSAIAAWNPERSDQSKSDRSKYEG
jgi:hypothetical protein